MAWWYYGPMDGDAPNEIREQIFYAIFGGTNTPARMVSEVIRHPKTIELMIAKQSEISKILALEKDGCTQLYWQVCGVILMAHGADISLVRDRILQAIEMDVWSGETLHQVQRTNHMHHFRRIVEHHKAGQAVSISETIPRVTGRGKRFETVAGAVIAHVEDSSLPSMLNVGKPKLH